MALITNANARELLNAVGICTVNVTDAALNLIQDQVQSQIEGYLQRKLTVQVHNEQFDISVDQDYLFIGNFPLHTIVGLTNDGIAVSTGDYVSYSDDGIIKIADTTAGILRDRGAYFTPGRQKVQITYFAGYTTIPADIQGVAANMIGRRLSGAGVSAFQSERIGNYSYSRAPGEGGGQGGFTGEDVRVLEQYRRRLEFEVW